MGPGIRIDQIWFARVADDLQISVIGTADRMTVTGWYGDVSHHLDGFATSDGSRHMNDAQVVQLVSAMAAFTAPPAGQFDLTQQQHAILDPVLAAVWS
jgi:hypothetical protein